ncbi:hypothetical protein Tco_0964619 [Tanacetum coccineum]
MRKEAENQGKKTIPNPCGLGFGRPKGKREETLSFLFPNFHINESILEIERPHVVTESVGVQMPLRHGSEDVVQGLWFKGVGEKTWLRDEVVASIGHGVHIRLPTTASSLEVEQDSGNINKTQSKATPNEFSSLGTNSGGGPWYPLTTRVFLDLEKTKTTQHNEIASLKMRVKKLEKKDRIQAPLIRSTKSIIPIHEMFDRAFKRVNTLKTLEQKLVEGNEKTARTELIQEIAKKQKDGDDKETLS